MNDFVSAMVPEVEMGRPKVVDFELEPLSPQDAQASRGVDFREVDVFGQGAVPA